MQRKKHLLAIQLADPHDYPSVLYGISTYRDGIFYVCSYLLSTGLYNIDLCQCSWGDFPTHYNLSKYDAILISALGHQVIADRELLTRLREIGRDKPIIIGGPHATFAPYDALRYADFAVIGPGEYPAENLINMICNGPYPTSDNLPDRVAIRSDAGALVLGSLKEQSPPMIPINTALFRTSPRLNWATVSFSRGCPYNCMFCYGVRIHGHKLIKKDVAVIIEELDKIYKATGCSNFYISDLSFGLDRRHTKEIIDKVRGMDYSFVTMVRVELGDNLDLVEDLKNVGFSDFFLGIESLSTSVLSSYNKMIDSDLQTQRVRAFSRKGLAVHGSFVIGADDQTYDDVLKTANWAAENEISYVCFALYTDYPYQKRLYGTYQMFPDWRIMQSSPAYQHYSYVSVFPKSMRPSKLQKTIIQAYKAFREKRLSTKELSSRITKIKIWSRNMRYILAKMEKYAQYLEIVETPYYTSNDELIENRLKEDYYTKVKGDPERFENMSIIMKSLE